MTCAIFAPNPESIIKMVEENCKKEEVDVEEVNQVRFEFVKMKITGFGNFVFLTGARSSGGATYQRLWRLRVDFS